MTSEIFLSNIKHVENCKLKFYSQEKHIDLKKKKKEVKN